MKTLLAVLAVVVAVSVPALADDKQPPPWTRGDDRTTFERWEFSDTNPAPLPDQLLNPYGVPQTTIVPKPGASWLPVYDNRIGVWPLSGYMDIVIPNVRDHLDWDKHLWVQLTWELEGSQLPIIGVQGPTGELVLGKFIEEDSFDGEPGHPWFHTTWEIILPFNPPEEILHIAGDIMVDELVVDTICVPEPITLSLLALGGLALLKRRR